MASHHSNFSHLFVITVLVAAVGSMLQELAVEGGACTEPLGPCGPAGDCDKRCKAEHSDGGGSCDMNLCTCYYDCVPPPSPPEKSCTSGLGLCTAECSDNCCNSKCASQFNRGEGYCNAIGGTRLCTCEYVCPPHLL